MQIIDRQSLAHEAAERLREQILDGHLAPGQRINEVHLAASLGVSRTPLREGLIRLESEGLVERSTGRGFSVCGLSAEEVREIYPIRAALESLALRAAEPPAGAELAELKALNWELSQESRPAGRASRDEQFHRGLLARCPNRRLLRLIETLAARCRHYEARLLTSGNRASEIAAQHSEMLGALQAGDVDGASAKLEAHLLAGVETMAERLA